MRRALLDWYAPRADAYPWRRTGDAYAVLVSEVMLQQTQASRVAPAFERFVAEFPTVIALAAAPLSAVTRAWDGLGYNRRAVALHRAARTIVGVNGGTLPRDPAELRSLPGVGPYTAAAVASIAFGAPVAAIDTNARRVVRRALGGRDDLERAEIDALAQAWLDRRRPAAWNQAVMDLGRASCRPRPACGGCPLLSGCRFVRIGARPIPTARAQPSFVGSARQARGSVVRALRSIPSASLFGLVEATGLERAALERAVASLVADGIVDAGPAAAAGSSRGRVRLAT